MDDDLGIPKSYFDYVISIYALGWTPDLHRTLSRIHDYLKPGGVFVFSWEHPVYKCLNYNKEINGFVFSESYLEERPVRSHSMKGIEGLDHVKYPRTLSTYINGIINVGLTIDRLVEPNIDIRMAREIDSDPEKYFSIPRAKLIPTTFIIKALKPV